jgi:YD repeat-containing protein
MKKLLCVLAIALAISGAAHGQTTIFHDAAGRVTGKARTNVDGSTTYYDAAGRVTSKASAPRR